jgi:hypothetical protein
MMMMMMTIIIIIIIITITITIYVVASAECISAHPFGDTNSCNIRDINTKPQRETE